RQRDQRSGDEGKGEGNAAGQSHGQQYSAMPFDSPRNNAPAQGRRPPTVPVMLAGFAAFVDLYATQPLLPLLARTFHASRFDVSLTITAPTVAVALAAPGIGRLADTDVSWSASFVALGAINFAVAVALAVWLPRERGASSVGATRLRRHEKAVSRGRAPARGSSLIVHLRNPQLIAAYAIGFCIL